MSRTLRARYALIVFLFTLLHLAVTISIQQVFARLPPIEPDRAGNLFADAIALPCVVVSAPLFGVLWGTGYISFERRRRLAKGHCRACGNRIGEEVTCQRCGLMAGRLCSKCGYSLRGIESNRCPECGLVQP